MWYWSTSNVGRKIPSNSFLHVDEKKEELFDLLAPKKNNPRIVFWKETNYNI